MPAVVNLGGRIVAPSDAKVSVFDRGFLYGDSVYEAIRTYGRAPFEVGAHLERLAGSAARVGFELPWDAARTGAEIDHTISASYDGEDPPPPSGEAPWNRGERALRIVMTRGAGELGIDPALAPDPLALIIARPLQAPPLEAYRRGVPAAIVRIARTADPAAKTGNYLQSVLAVKEARARGAHEALLVDADGFVTEGATSNVFWVDGGRLATPPLDIGILEGVTRAVVLALASEAGIEAREARITPDALAAADEIFITSTARELLPVVSLDGRPVGSGVPGPLHARLHALFRARAGG